MQLTAPMPACVKPRDSWQYVSGPHEITAGTEQVFDLPVSRGPLGFIQVRLFCIVANNGYEPEDEAPIELVARNAAAADDGAPRWSWRVHGSQVKLFIASSSIQIVDTSGNIGGTFTPGQWLIKIYAVA